MHESPGWTNIQYLKHETWRPSAMMIELVSQRQCLWKTNESMNSCMNSCPQPSVSLFLERLNNRCTTRDPSLELPFILHHIHTLKHCLSISCFIIFSVKHTGSLESLIKESRHQDTRQGINGHSLNYTRDSSTIDHTRLTALMNLDHWRMVNDMTCLDRTVSMTNSPDNAWRLWTTVVYCLSMISFVR